jgi:hypothetical protein
VGKTVGFKCECGGWPRYENWDGMAVMNCNSCGWNAKTGEKWDPDKHEDSAKTTDTKNKGCFIATAAFEKVLAPEVEYLRGYRDCVLNNSKRGRAFIHVYCFLSPPMAQAISKSLVLKMIVREILLKPMIRFIDYLYPTLSLKRRSQL